jgi:hypothetical protein
MKHDPGSDPLADALLHGYAAHWPGVSARGSLILPLDSTPFLRLPGQLELDGRVLGRKEEFHITLLNAEQWAAVEAGPGERVARELFEGHEWELRGEGRYWLVGNPGSGDVCVIATARAPALVEFRRALREQGVALEPPRPHVTLYCSRDGIGIAGPSQWDERVVGELTVDWDGAAAGLRRSG